MKTQHKMHITLSKEHSSKASCKKTHKGEKKEFLGQMSQPLHTILKQPEVLVVCARGQGYGWLLNHLFMCFTYHTLFSLERCIFISI
jgi:hypothetical protein